MKFKEAVTYDDMLIVPQYSDIESRKEVDIGNNLGHRKFRLPIISSPMDTVTQADMAIAMYRSGGLGVLHRYNTITDQQNMARKVIDHTEWSGNVAAAIGVTGEYLKRAEALVSVGVDVLCVDVAHGHHALMKKALTTLREALLIIFIICNVCTLEGINDLTDWGADAVRCNIGGGSICSTRLVTGTGSRLQTIFDCRNGQTSRSSQTNQNVGRHRKGFGCRSRLCNVRPSWQDN